MVHVHDGRFQHDGGHCGGFESKRALLDTVLGMISKVVKRDEGRRKPSTTTSQLLEDVGYDDDGELEDDEEGVEGEERNVTGPRKI